MKHTNSVQICHICKFECMDKSQLSNHLNSVHINVKADVEKTTIDKLSPNKSISVTLHCEHCGYECKIMAQLNSHIKWKHINIRKEKEYNCDHCAFQGTSEFELNKHINLKHIGKNQPMRQTIKCRNCDEQFSEKWNLMLHRKQKHIESVAFCRKKRDGMCPFSNEKCWWSHKKRQAHNIEQIECYFCDEILKDKPSLMKHRKAEHKSLIRKCEKYLKNNCPRESDVCWYLHEDVIMEIEEQNDKDKAQEPTKTSGFQDLFPHTKPPINQ